MSQAKAERSDDREWLAVCKAHGTQVLARSRQDARTMDTAEFCDDCRNQPAPAALASAPVRRGAATRAVFASATSAERWYQSLGLGTREWEVEEVAVSDVEQLFAENKRWKMTRDSRGYLISVPNIYANEFYLVKL